MIAGLGLDVCEIARMEQLLKNQRFLSRFFAPEERAYIENRGMGAAQSLAGMFAAKEALTKALGVGLTAGELTDIRVLHDPLGAPYFDLRGEFARLTAERGITAWHLSIAHDGGVAAAVAIAER